MRVKDAKIAFQAGKGAVVEGVPVRVSGPESRTVRLPAGGPTYLGNLSQHTLTQGIRHTLGKASEYPSLTP